jgi:hypothetical protein
MRARSPIAAALGGVERWIFAPGDPRRLAGCRIGLCLLLGVRLSRPLYLQTSGQPEALFRPISFMRLFDTMPGAPVVLAVQIIAVAACLAGAAGILTKTSMAAAWTGALFLNGMWSSLGQPMHNETLLMLAFVPLLFAPCADAWSVHAARHRTPPPGVSIRYGWPVRTAMIVTAGGYFFTGLNKLVFSGPAWALSDNIRWVMYRISDESRHPIQAALLLAGHPLLTHIVAALTLVTEIGFVVVLWKPAALWFFLPGVVLLHAGIGITMHLDYAAWALTSIVVFVPWEGVAERLASRRAGAARGRPRLQWVAPAPRSE